MGTKDKRAFLIIATVVILLFGCIIFGYKQQQDRHPDPFYRYSVDWFDNYSQFPLIKPYYALLFPPSGDGWNIHLEGSPLERDFYYYLNVKNVRKIAVEKGIIMIYTLTAQEVEADLGEKVLYWFVIVPDQNIEMGFDQEEDFQTYVHQLGVQEPAWRQPDDIMLEFAQTGCLDWIPGCE